MAVNTAGKNAAADGIGQLANLQFVATVGATETATATVTFDEAVAGVIDVASSVTLTIPSGTISNVYLRVVGETLANSLAAITLDDNNEFPAGGDLIVTKFEITVA